MIQLPFIEPGSTLFPSTDTALQEPNGLLAFGGDLSPKQLLAAYRQGIFPWFDDDSPILWWSPSPRLIMEPSDLHVSKSMRKLLRKQRFEVTVDQAFSEVMLACAEPREDQGTWITDEMLYAYEQLHELGHAHSIEVWQEQQLVGGLYGIHLGKAYFGESMFSRTSNASKYGFILLAQALERLGFELIDCQVYTSHLASLGAYEVSREEFERKLAKLVDSQAQWPSTADLIFQAD